MPPPNAQPQLFDPGPPTAELLAALCDRQSAEIRTLRQRVKEAEAEVSAVLDMCNQSSEARIEVLKDIKKKTAEFFVRCASAITQRDIAVQCLRDLVKDVCHTIDVSEYREPHDDIAKSYRHAVELLKVVDSAKTT